MGWNFLVGGRHENGLAVSISGGGVAGIAGHCGGICKYRLLDGRLSCCQNGNN